MAATFERISAAARALVERGIVPVTIGGDHWIAYPLLHGVATPCPARRSGSSISTPITICARRISARNSAAVPFRKALELPGAPALGRNLVQIGMAEFANSPFLADYAREMGVTVFPQLAVRQQGMDAVVSQALERAADGTDAIYVSVDIDSIDQSQAPGTAAPNPAGSIYATCRRRCDASRAIPRPSASISSRSRRLTISNMTGRTGAALVLNFLYGLASKIRRLRRSLCSR